MYSVTATNTAPPLTVVYSWASPITLTVSMASTFVGLAALDQHDVVLPPQLNLRDIIRSYVGLISVLQQQQPQYQMSSQAYANYAVGPSQVRFALQS